MAQIEHHCCTATLLVVILSGVKIYLDQRLQLKGKKSVVISLLLKEKKFCYYIKGRFALTYLLQSTYIHFFNGWNDKKQKNVSLG